MSVVTDSAHPADEVELIVKTPSFDVTERVPFGTEQVGFDWIPEVLRARLALR